jgi:outer membrane protein OmpA-like peptidoglycan-associated protein
MKTGSDFISARFLTRFSWPLASAVVLSLGGCVTVPKDAPAELHDAQAAIDKAKADDADGTAPKTIKRAENELDGAVSLFKESKKSDVDDPDVLKSDASKQALKAKNEAEQALALHNDVKKWDQDISIYTAMRNDANQKTALEKRLHAANEMAQNQGVSEDFLLRTPVVFFKTDSSKLMDNNDAAVKQLATLLKNQPDLQVELIGYADYRGPESYNEALSERRASHVANRLEDMGIASSRIKVEYKGATAAARVQDAGRLQLDRRVDARVMGVAH